MGIKHRADSGFRKFSTLNKLCLGGQVRSSETPYVPYPKPLALIKRIKMYRFTLLFLTLSVCGSVKAQFNSEQIINSNANGAVSIFSIDIDGDLDYDIIVASNIHNKITWYSNLGNGLFSSENIISNNVLEPVAVYCIDLDNDNDNDVISANYGDSTITWFENLGGGTFSSKIVLSNNAAGARSVYAADMDSDNEIDILAASFDDQKVTWYKNFGGGIFGPEQIISQFNGSPAQVFCDDLDGDNDSDILIADALNDITWIENLGGGSFASEQIIGTLFYLDDVYSGDLDNDGDSEIIATGGYQMITLYENLGSGNFGSEQIVTDSAGGGKNIYVFDLNSDGLLDILSAERSSNRIVWYENLGSLSFSAPHLIADYSVNLSDEIFDVYAADFNSDGALDVAATKYTSMEVVWFENLLVSSIDDAEAFQISISPNPSRDIFNINMLELSGLITIRVLNGLGREVEIIHNVYSHSIEIDLENLPNGIYLLEISNNESKIVKKVIKQSE